MIVSVCNDSNLSHARVSHTFIPNQRSVTDPLNWTKSFKFSPQIFFRSFIAQPRYKKGLEGITPDLWIVRCFIYYMLAFEI